MRRFAIAGAACAVVLLAAGCASPVPQLYTLSPLTAPAGGAAAPLAVSVLLGPVSIPAIVDQPQIVMSSGANKVAFEEFNRWATPLADDISRVLALNLSAALGSPRVSLFRQTVAPDADYRIKVEVQGFESAADAATLNATYTVRRTRDGTTLEGRSVLREATGAAGFEALAAAHSRALARLGQDLAWAVRGLGP